MKNSAQEAMKVVREVQKAVIGKDHCIEKVMAAVLAGGHILIEDIPGVGKTTMAMAFSKAMALKEKRMQFTPDVLPSDVTGFFMFQKDSGKFKYVAGPVISNLFLADEINRTSPKTQSALLEVMEERRVTIDGHVIRVPEPFIVIATQNPTGSSGTQNLPESQLDRFMICISMGYPDIHEEINIIKNHHGNKPLEQINPVIDTEMLLELQRQTEQIYIHDAVYEYIARLVMQTRQHDLLKLGISPRGTLALCRMAQGLAFLRDRDYVLPEDVSYVFPDVAIHRIILHSKAKVTQVTAENIIDDILAAVTKPVPKSRRQG